jgi:hypothetical protein
MFAKVAGGPKPREKGRSFHILNQKAINFLVAEFSIVAKEVLGVSNTFIPFSV